MAEIQQQTNATRWLLKYGDRVYGPYNHDAMTGYIAEGRVIGSSVIAPEGTAADGAGWTTAGETEAFAGNFAAPKDADRVAPNYRSPMEQAAEAEAQVVAPQPETTADARPVYGPAKGQTDRRRQPETANFIVIMDIKARYAGNLEQAIMSLGPAYKLAPNVWCVNADSTAAGLLNDLSIHIGKTDSMFIVDATRDRTAWHNLGPETDAKLRRVWRRAF
ncbi:MAG: hypothetical protein ACOH12_13100 [Parvibaculaceae bacterium]